MTTYVGMDKGHFTLIVAASSYGNPKHVYRTWPQHSQYQDKLRII